jgi:hypothetical protein
MADPGGAARVAGALAIGLCALSLAVPAGASAGASCKFKPSLLNGAAHSTFKTPPKQTSRTVKKRIAGASVTLTRIECVYLGKKGKRQTRVGVGLLTPFTAAEAQSEQSGTIQLGKNNAEEGAIGEAYAPLAADYAVLYKPPGLSPGETEIYGEALKGSAWIITDTSVPNNSHAAATGGAVLKVAFAHVKP